MRGGWGRMRGGLGKMRGGPERMREEQMARLTLLSGGGGVPSHLPLGAGRVYPIRRGGAQFD